ncbi:hypothetical protein DL96DRAFT_1617787 [Flagelloscypha sp. PMI_526]|nr:hypothetical protein DL96DRAFT_1617787 [Flagelloscypha sp. PMI_526]
MVDQTMSARVASETIGTVATTSSHRQGTPAELFATEYGTLIHACAPSPDVVAAASTFLSNARLTRLTLLARPDPDNDELNIKNRRSKVRALVRTLATLKKERVQDPDLLMSSSSVSEVDLSGHDVQFEQGNSKLPLNNNNRHSQDVTSHATISLSHPAQPTPHLARSSKKWAGYLTGQGRLDLGHSFEPSLGKQIIHINLRYAYEDFERKWKDRRSSLRRPQDVANPLTQSAVIPLQYARRVGAARILWLRWNSAPFQRTVGNLVVTLKELHEDGRQVHVAIPAPPLPHCRYIVHGKSRLSIDSSTWD